ncbi:MAG TPA: hypothetical protein VMS64_29715 [Candidatus Methylomirabilis sp.]|nr:hypothetical protein [Candidatus Methylomirabilis sp.]
MTKRIGLALMVVVMLVTAGAVMVHGASSFSIQLGPETLVLSLPERQALDFMFGPPDGYLGVHRRHGTYTFFVPARSSSTTSCSTPNIQGTYRLGGSLTQFNNAYGCAASLKDGLEGNVEPNGYSFDRDYSGGGPVARLTLGGRSAILMVYHGEWHPGASCLSVPWFYGALGMAVSTDQGATFQSLGEIVQPYPTRAQGLGTSSDCHNVHVGYGTLVLADAQGNELPRRERSNMDRGFFYVFYTDTDPTIASGPCSGGAYCIALARARRADVAAAAAAGDTAAFPSLFKKYYCSSPSGPCGFTEPGTGGDPDNATNSGHYTPLFAQAASQPTVLYDRTIKQFLMAYQSAFQLFIQASPNLLQWSGTPLPNGTLNESPSLLGYPTLVGEGSNPSIGGASPYLFYLSTVTSFPNWTSTQITQYGNSGANYVSRRIQISVP